MGLNQSLIAALRSVFHMCVCNYHQQRHTHNTHANTVCHIHIHTTITQFCSSVRQEGPQATGGHTPTHTHTQMPLTHKHGSQHKHADGHTHSRYHKHTYIHINTHIHIHTQLPTQARTQKHTHANTHAHTHTHTHRHTHTHTQAFKYTHSYTHPPAPYQVQLRQPSS